MKKIGKRFLALLLTALLILGCSGCYDEDLTWAAEYNGERLPIGAYLYFLSEAYNTVARDLTTDEKVLSGTMEGEAAPDWIREQAKTAVSRYFFVESELERLGAPANETDESSASAVTDSYWAMLETSLTGYGISRDSFHKAYALYNTLYLRLFQTLYGTGGEKEVPESDLVDYFRDNFLAYEYFSDTTYSYGTDGTYIDMTDEELEEIRGKFEDLAEEVRGGKPLETVASDYATTKATTSNYISGAETEDGLTQLSMPTDLVTALKEMEEDEVRVVELASSILLVRKRPLAQAQEETMADEEKRLEILNGVAGEDFSDYVLAGANALTGVTMNDRAMARCDLDRFAKNNPNGYASAPSDETSEEAQG